MKIYTRTGDEGETGLLGGERVPKDHPRLEATGTIDELNALIGWLRAAKLDEDLDQVLEKVQHQLFDMGAELASHDATKLERHFDVVALEETIDAWGRELESLTDFILPGGVEAAARAHVVRSVARRAERKIVGLGHDIEISGDLMKYLNRFSDMIFVMARVINQRAGCPDKTWKKS